MCWLSHKFDTNIEILNLIRHWVIGTFVGTQRESSLSFGITFIVVAEKQTVIWFTIVHASRDQEGSFVYLPDGRVDRIFRHYAGIISSFSPSPLCTSATSRQRDWRVISLTVLRLPSFLPISLPSLWRRMRSIAKISLVVIPIPCRNSAFNVFVQACCILNTRFCLNYLNLSKNYDQKIFILSSLTKTFNINWYQYE